jgi:hypothetical protein
MCAGLLRIGVARYFELSEDTKLDPLRALMRDVFSEDEWIPPKPVAGPPSAAHLKIIAHIANGREFDAAIEEGNRHFEASRC